MQRLHDLSQSVGAISLVAIARYWYSAIIISGNKNNSCKQSKGEIETTMSVCGTGWRNHVGLPSAE
jgi:hypothetical protein